MKSVKIRYVGKALLVEENGKRVLALGDLHFGFNEAIQESGYLVDGQMYNEIIGDVERIFERVGRVDEIVLVGDLKHVFGGILKEEWGNIVNFIRFLKEKCDKIVVVKGNHDVALGGIMKMVGKINIEVVDYYIARGVCYIHGNRDFKEIYNEKIKMWVIGHGHPAVWVGDKIRKEKYKCFLAGRYCGREIIILPSFFPFSEGTDAREQELGLAWEFEVRKFKVLVVDGLDAMDFGELGKMEKKE